MVYVWKANPLQLPSPQRVMAAVWSLLHSGKLLAHAAISTARLGIALVVAIVLAVPLGFAMGLNAKLDACVDPLVELLRPVSGIAWIPLGLFIFGISNTLPVFIMVYVAVFPLLLNTVAGVRQVDRRLAVLESSKYMADNMQIEKALTWDTVRARFQRTAPLVKQAYNRLGSKPAASEFVRTDMPDLRGRPVWDIDKWANVS